MCRVTRLRKWQMLGGIRAPSTTLPPASASALVPIMPNFRYIYRELLRSGVTLKLLWEEYVDSYRQSHQLYFRYSQFCKRYRDHVEQSNLTMHIRHKPSNRIMVDWGGTNIPLEDPASSKQSSAYLFVAVLPFSMYCYAAKRHVPHLAQPESCHSAPASSCLAFNSWQP